ncbi:hypothetical protein DOY81_011851 [Sarcophaga bullata]|nr:hypothetical protein DOY81_011851 [Sarcophaga bullata]
MSATGINAQIINDYKAGVKHEDLCAKYSKNKSTISKIIKQYHAEATAISHQSSRSFKKPPFSEHTRIARLKFANDHLSWTKENWHTVIFTAFNLKSLEKQCCLKRPTEPRQNVKSTKPKFAEGGLILWGCFASTNEDNSTPYPLSYKNILNDVRYSYVDEDWPEQSADLNPIEHLWEIMEKQLPKKFVNRQELINAVTIEWKQFNMKIINNLIDSMTRRCIEIIENKGYPIRSES